MEVVAVDSDIADVFGLVIAWGSVIAAILAWLIGLGMIPEVNEAFIILFDLFEPLLDTFVDFTLFIF
jgi:hypothetical protein